MAHLRWRRPVHAASLLALAALSGLVFAASPAFAQGAPSTKWPNQREGDFIIKDFRFKSGETIAELKQHYATLGTPKPGFEIAVNVMGVRVTESDAPDDIEAALMGTKAGLGFYIGGMGSKSRNFHKELMARMDFEREADTVQDLFFAGKRDEAIAAVPTAFADEISLVGTKARIADKLEAWK